MHWTKESEKLQFSSAKTEKPNQTLAQSAKPKIPMPPSPVKDWWKRKRKNDTTYTPFPSWQVSSQPFQPWSDPLPRLLSFLRLNPPGAWGSATCIIIWTRRPGLGRLWNALEIFHLDIQWSFLQLWEGKKKKFQNESSHKTLQIEMSLVSLHENECILDRLNTDTKQEHS